MKTAFIYTDQFEKFDYGPSHPLKTYRLKLTYELIKSYGLLLPSDNRYIEAKMAGNEDLLMYHKKEYIEILELLNRDIIIPGAENFGLGPGDNPIFEGLFDWSRLVTGASLKAASLVDSGEADIAFNISGGLHHAMASRASGFCYINDPVISIMSLLKKGRKVAYIDIDAHHGDGVQDAFYSTDKVLTISIHETGHMLFPGLGFEHEIGKDEGKGYSVNIPMPPYSDDELFLLAFNEIVPPLIEKFLPDIVVTQLGADSFVTDPLAHLNYTNRGFCEVIKRIKEIAKKWVALGGGGYHVANVAKAWALAWAIMNDVELKDDIPKDFLDRYSKEGFQSGKIWDEIYVERRATKEQLKKELKRVIDFIKENVFPRIR